MITDKGPKVEQLSTRRRKEWLTKMNRKNWVPISYAYACSIHFVGGIKANLLNDTNSAWVPTIMMGYTTKEGDLSHYNHCKGEGSSRTIVVLSVLHHLLTIHKMKIGELYFIK